MMYLCNKLHYRQSYMNVENETLCNTEFDKSLSYFLSYLNGY